MVPVLQAGEYNCHKCECGFQGVGGGPGTGTGTGPGTGPPSLPNCPPPNCEQPCNWPREYAWSMARLSQFNFIECPVNCICL